MDKKLSVSPFLPFIAFNRILFNPKNRYLCIIFFLKMINSNHKKENKSMARKKPLRNVANRYPQNLILRTHIRTMRGYM